MSDLKRFRDMVLKVKEDMKKHRTPEFNVMRELTDSEEFRKQINKYADITVKLINKDINFEDYRIALAMIRATVDFGILFLMEKHGVQFLKEKEF